MSTQIQSQQTSQQRIEAIKSAFVKLLPQHMLKNPVMGIVWLGTLITAFSTVAGYTCLLYTSPSPRD